MRVPIVPPYTTGRRHIRLPNYANIISVQLVMQARIKMGFGGSVEPCFDPKRHSKRKVHCVLRCYGPVNPMGSCRARSVYLTTRLLGRLSPLSG